MASPWVIEISEPGRDRRRVEIDRTVEVGRDVDESDGHVLVDDPRSSRRHAEVRPGEGWVVVADLGSSNGTEIDGRAITEPVTLGAGDTFAVGDTTVRIVAQVGAPPPKPDTHAPVPAAPPDAVDPLRPASVVRPQVDRLPRPGTTSLATIESPDAIVRYRPGSFGERVAQDVLTAATTARGHLRGFGSESLGQRPTVLLIDPYPDAATGAYLTGGTLVDVGTGSIWLVVTPEAPPEPLERSLAVLFGTSFPAAEELAPIIEGYGLQTAQGSHRSAALAGQSLPPLELADGELRSAMAASFVRYLIELESREVLLATMANAQPGRVDDALAEAFGGGLAALEQRWTAKLAGESREGTAGFFRMTTRYLRAHALKQGEVFLYMLVGLGFTSVFPFVNKRLFDTALPKGIAEGTFAPVASLLVLLAVLFALSLVANVRRSYVSAQISGSIVRQLRTDMFAKLQRLGPGWYDGHHQGDVLGRMFTDVAVLEQGLSQTLREGIFQALSLIVSSVILIKLNPMLGIITVLGAPTVAIVYKAMGKGAIKRSMAVQDQTAEAYNVATENYQAQPVVQAFLLEAREMTRFGRVSDRLYRAEVRMSLFGGLFGLSVNGIVTVLRIAILGLGSYFIVHGRMSVGTLVAFLGVMGEVINPVTQLTGVGQEVQQSGAALLRINEVLETVPDVTETDDAVDIGPIREGVTLDGVDFAYTPERLALDGVSLRFPAGTKTAIVGPSGSGKSSIMQVLLRFYDPQQGRVTLDGTDLCRVSLASLRRQVSVVFQESFLFAGTIRENLLAARPDATEDDLRRALDEAELTAVLAAMPRGLDTPVGDRGGRLSGGQRQRIAIARALLRDPSVLLLDEATSALDAHTERQIARTLDRVAEGRTTIAVTHRLASITGYDQIVVVVGGRVAEVGTHEELVATGRVYAELWAEQSGQPIPDPQLDLAAMVAQVPFLGGCPHDEIQAVIERLRAIDLPAGSEIAEGDGLTFVRRGKAQVLFPDGAGGVTPVAELYPGDVFGVSAVLGQGSGAIFAAPDGAGALVLDRAALDVLSGHLPILGAALAGIGVVAERPPKGAQPLSRATVALSALAGPATNVGPDVGSVQDRARRSMVLPRVG